MHDIGIGEATRQAIAKEKDHTLSIRLPKSDIAPIDRAANLRGRSRTDFVREAGDGRLGKC
jgi:uncharacterized protein (DUF1778 family)